MLQMFLRTHWISSVASSLLALGIAALVSRSALPVRALRQDPPAVSKRVTVARTRTIDATSRPAPQATNTPVLRQTLQRLAQRLDRLFSSLEKEAGVTTPRTLPDSILSPLLNGGRDGQVLSIQNGKLLWMNPPTGTSNGYESGGGRRPPSNSGGGGGGYRERGGGGGGSPGAQADVRNTAIHGHTDDPHGGKVDINAATNGVLGADRGGTSFAQYTTGALLVGNAAGGLSNYRIGSGGDILSVTGGLVRWKPFTSVVQGPSDSRYVNTSGDTMTGALTINLSSGFLGLRILQTASGNVIHAEKTLTSSGTILSVGNVSTWSIRTGGRARRCRRSTCRSRRRRD